MSPVRKPEIMSPAGHWPQLRAAVEAGADSVYFGLTHFSARAKVGFTVEELPTAMAELHRRGVKGYVTFNTLVFDTELAEAAKAIETIARAGVDAIIVQDLGVCSLVQQIAPDLEIHGSTQMSITSADGVRLAQRLGARRVNLARELSLEEIAKIRSETDCELEIFVHGALCVAYSGQCFSSEAWGGRSANRGQCAQACRLPYELMVDGVETPLGDARYLLSPGDLYTLDWIPKLLPLGIASLKIEGRYKDAEYVAITTQAYRQALDEAWKGIEKARDPIEKIRLEQVYSRGLGPFFLSGTNHQTVVQGRGPRHRGVLMGRVSRVGDHSIQVTVNDAHAVAPLKLGDGVVLDAADWRSPQEAEEGGRIYALRPLGGRTLELEFANGAIRFDRIRVGDLLWRSHDAEVDRFARQWTELSKPLRKRSVDVRVEAKVGEPLRSYWKCGQEVLVESGGPLVRAQQQGLSQETLAAQFSRLGNTIFELRELQASIAGEPFVPVSMLNQMRREAVEKLEAFANEPVVRHVTPYHFVSPVAPPLPAQQAQLHLLIRSPKQLEAAIAAQPASITLDYLDLYGLRPAVEHVRASGVPVRVASPRVLKPGEEKIADFLVKLDCQILVRAAGLLDRLQQRHVQGLIGDFSLNAANAVSARMLLEMGLDRLTPTHDLNAAQLVELARLAGANRIEVVAYQHLPVFHTEHCVFCRFLSEGTSYLDCGRPCEHHEVTLRDEQGREHPLVADVGCRNTVFGAEAQSGAAHVANWKRIGIAHFRLEFVHESAEQIRQIADGFRDLLANKSRPADLDRLIRQVQPAGLTEGSLHIPKKDAVFQIL
ncbi:U32 family peptidase [Bryobacter aggregatus]|uniref:U32 family peptidase n=1 Tax=Bryobacter aggregatus TaxID=360054 RepID=UPI0004E1164E|nr:U32 family peptidase [Bryobacter aggregatus]